MFSQPEEKLWLIVKDFKGGLMLNGDAGGEEIKKDANKGLRLEKNSVIKMGRVRLRVRDIDYAPTIPKLLLNNKNNSEKHEK